MPRFGFVSRNPRIRSALPGLAVTAVATAVAFLVAYGLPGLNSTTVAVILGIAVANVGLHRPWFHRGTYVAAHQVLRLSVVLLGLQLSVRTIVRLGLPGLVVVLVTVGVTFAGTLLIGRLLRVEPARRLLVATGFSICGASAVAAMSPVAGGKKEDASVAVALVTLCGSLAIFVLPVLRGPLGLDPTMFGAWVGASVHDVGQTVATASRVPGALATAVVVKLTRVVLLAPLVAGVGLRRRAERPARSLPVPLFVLGFLAAVGVASTGWLPGGVLHSAATVQSVLLTGALFGLGTGINVRSLVRTGGRTLVLGLASWVLVAVVAYVGVRLVG